MSEIKHLRNLGAQVKEFKENFRSATLNDFYSHLNAQTLATDTLYYAAQQTGLEKWGAARQAYEDSSTGEVAVAAAMFATKNAELEGKFAVGGSDAVTTGVAISDKGTELTTLFAQRESEILADIAVQATAEGDFASFESAMLSSFNSMESMNQNQYSV